MARFLKAFVKCLIGVAAAIAIPALVYKMMDEKLSPEAAEFFKEDPQTQEQIRITSAVLEKMPQLKFEDVPSGLCSPQNPTLKQTAWTEFKAKNPALIQAAYEVMALPVIAFSNKKLGDHNDQFWKVRNAFVIIENETCADANTVEKRWEILNQMAKQVLESTKAENTSRFRSVNLRVLKTVVSKLQLIEKINKDLAARSNLKQLKASVEQLTSTKLYEDSAKAEARLMYNSLNSHSDSNDFDWLGAFSGSISHWNKGKNIFVKNYLKMGGEEEVVDLDSGRTNLNSYFRSPFLANGLTESNLKGSKDRLRASLEDAQMSLAM